MALARNSGTFFASALIWCLLLFASASLKAEESSGHFEVLFAELTLDKEVYRLDAGFDLQLSDQLREALHSGVTLTFKVEMEVGRERAWIWDATVAEVSQEYRVRYIDLSGQYELYNANSGLRFNLPTYELLMAVLGNLSNFPLIDAALLDAESSYWARLRVSVDTESLPTPLRLMAYVSSGWRLQSDWFTWILER